MRMMKVGCTCGFIAVCGVIAFIAQLVGIIIPKALVLELDLHRDVNITLDKLIETVHMEVEEEDSDEDDILEIDSLTRDDKDYMHNIERLILEERNNELRNGTAVDTKRTRVRKRNLKTNGSVIADVNTTEVSNLENDYDDDIGVAQNRSSVIANRTICEDSSEETSEETSEEEEEENEEKGEENRDGEEDDDVNTSSCSESSESGEEETESHSVYSSISIGLWNSHLCTKDGTNHTECAIMSFRDALHIVKKDAGFTGTDFDLSMWNNVRTESIFSLVCCVFGLVFLAMSVTRYFRTRQPVLLVFGSFGFVSSGVLTTVPVTRIIIVSIDTFRINSEGTQTLKMGFPWSVLAFSVSGVFSMIAAFGLISVTWYDRKQKWRLQIQMTKYFDAELEEHLKDSNVARLYSEPERVESMYCDVYTSPSDQFEHKSNEDQSNTKDEQREKRRTALGTRRVETIEITNISERETFI